MTSDQLAGLPLDMALDLLKKDGIHPEIIFSEPPAGHKDMAGRTPRVVRFKDNRLLCSHFRDAFPEAQ